MRWQDVLKTNFKQVEKLADFWQLTPQQREQIHAHPRFVLNLPLRLAEKARKRTLDDPIVRQFLPLVSEQIQAPGDKIDPVNDNEFQCTPRLLKKYRGRVLLLATGACAMNCRFCFRQNFDYPRDKNFSEEIAHIEQATDVHEVILSGGDPLALPNAILENILGALGEIRHVKKIRFHSRFIMGIPERVDNALLDLFARQKQQIVFVLHSNHVNEFDEEVWRALTRIHRQGAILLNQSTFLAGVNDDTAALASLCIALVDHGVIPYYLHQLDPVTGTSHFAVDKEKGNALIAELQASLPGYAVPKYVQEIPGQPSKTTL